MSLVDLEGLELPIVDDVTRYDEFDDEWKVRPSKTFDNGLPMDPNAAYAKLESMYIELAEEKLVYQSVSKRLIRFANNSVSAESILGGLNNAITPFDPDMGYRRHSSEFSDISHSISVFERGSQYVEHAGIDVDRILADVVIIDYLNMVKNVGQDRLNAYRNAINLCKKYLTQEEWDELLNDKHITIKSKKYPDVKFVVPENGKVSIFKGERLMVESCAIVDDMNYSERFPIGDVILSKVMAIKSDEEYFVKSANNQYYAHVEEFQEYYEMKKEAVVAEWDVQDAEVLTEGNSDGNSNT